MLSVIRRNSQWSRYPESFFSIKMALYLWQKNGIIRTTWIVFASTEIMGYQIIHWLRSISQHIMPKNTLKNASILLSIKHITELKYAYMMMDHQMEL